MDVAYYFMRMKEDNLVAELCIAGASDPNQTVSTLAPDGTKQFWDKRWEGDLLVFHPPDGYAGDQPLEWHYNKLFQRGKRATQEVLGVLKGEMGAK